VFFNKDHRKHIKIGPVKILSDGYHGKTIAEEIRNPLTDIITTNNTTYVVCKRTATMEQVLNDWLKFSRAWDNFSWQILTESSSGRLNADPNGEQKRYPI
jgi:hypothetical protein